MSTPVKYTRPESRLSLTLNQFFGRKPLFTALLIVLILFAWVLPPFIDLGLAPYLLRVLLVIVLIIGFSWYYAIREVHSIKLDQNSLKVQYGYLIPSDVFALGRHLEINVTVMSEGFVKGEISQFIEDDLQLGFKGLQTPKKLPIKESDRMKICDEIDLLSLDEWKTLSDNGPIALTVDYTYPELEELDEYALDDFEIYPTQGEEYFADGVFTSILEFVNAREEVEFLGKTEYYNAIDEIEQEDICHEFLYRKKGKAYPLTICKDMIEFSCKNEKVPKFIRELCQKFGLQVVEE